MAETSTEDAIMADAITADAVSADAQPEEHYSDGDNGERGNEQRIKYKPESPKFMARFVAAARVAYNNDKPADTNPWGITFSSKRLLRKDINISKTHSMKTASIRNFGLIGDW